MVAGRIKRARSSAALVLDPFVEIPRKARAKLVEGGKALLRFAEPDAQTAEVRIG